MDDEGIAVSAAILTAEFVRREQLDETEAVRLWRRLRRRMIAALGREDVAAASAAAAATPIDEPPEVEAAPVAVGAPAPKAPRVRNRKSPA